MVSIAVKNTTSLDHIVEYDGRLIQKIYPIYFDDHKPAHGMDFSANLFQPTKHLFGVTFDTVYFNISVIWLMTVALFITLYFDLLKKFMKIFEYKKYRKREKN
jgi:hypothetical protein